MSWTCAKVPFLRLPLAAALITLLVRSPIAGVEPSPAPAAPGTRSLYLLDVPFLHFGPLRPADASGFDVAVAYGNTFSHSWHALAIKQELGTLGQPFLLSEAEELHRRHPQDTILFVDGDVTRLSFLASLSLTKELSVGLEVPWISFTALDGDGAVEGFHRTFGLRDWGHRSSFPRNRFEVVLQAPNGPLQFADATPSAGLGDVVTTLSWRRQTASRWHLGADLALKLPTGNANELRGSGFVDGGILLGASKTFGRSERWIVRAEGGVVFPGGYRGAVPLTLEPSTFFRILIGGGVRIWSGTWLTISAVGEQSPLHRQNIGDVAGPGGELSLGLTQRLFARGTLELSVTENLPSFGDAADVAVALRLRCELPPLRPAAPARLRLP